MSDVAAIEQFVKRYKELQTEIAKVIVGQEAVVNQILVSIFSLLENIKKYSDTSSVFFDLILL